MQRLHTKKPAHNADKRQQTCTIRSRATTRERPIELIKSHNDPSRAHRKVRFSAHFSGRTTTTYFPVDTRSNTRKDARTVWSRRVCINRTETAAGRIVHNVRANHVEGRARARLQSIGHAERPDR